jgi:putative ABC transport system permease protein
VNINIKLIARSFIKDKSHLAMNIFGLTTALICSVTVITWAKNEFNYDKHLPDADRIYRLTFETNISGNRLHFARCWENWVSKLPGVFPQIEELVRLSPLRHTAIKADENKFYSDMVFATDSNFFKVFGIDLLYGDAEEVLKEPNSVVITSSLAGKCFQGMNPVGQIIFLSGEYDEKMTPYTVKGIMKDSPPLSHIHFDILTSFKNPEEWPGWAYVYLLLKNNTNPGDIIKGFPSFLKEAVNETDQVEFTPYLQKISDIHLHSGKDRELETNGNITSIYLFISIAVIMLLISWVNYYNLSEARIPILKKQLLIQLISGSDKKSLVVQSLLESGSCVLVSLILATIILCLFKNTANSVFGFNLLPNEIKDLINIWYWVLIIFSISVLAGSLPLIQNIYTENKTLTLQRELSHTGMSRSFAYGLLMIIQFCLSIGLLICTLTIYHQREIILKSRMGKENSEILVFKKLNWEIRLKYNSIRNKALQNPFIERFTASMEEPTGETLDAMNVESSAIDENHINKQLFVISTDEIFLDFFNVPLVSGRDFSPLNPERKGEDYILNETAVKYLGWTPDEAIGKPFKVKFSVPDIFYGGTVIGVARDFNFNTLRQEIKPYVLFQKPIFYICFFAEVNPAHKTEAVGYLEKIWKEDLPDYPFQYEYLSDLYNSAYRKEFSQARLTAIFSMLSIIVICLGLYTVTSVMVAHRTKEIGIRKVNGARLIDILVLLTSDFIIWLAIAFTIACPLAIILMNKWLQSFAYKTELKWWFFAVSGLIIFLVTLTTVSFQSMRAASKNPVETLRYE